MTKHLSIVTECVSLPWKARIRGTEDIVLFSEQLAQFCKTEKGLGCREFTRIMKTKGS